MRLRLLALFILVPLLELALLIRVGEMIGLWNTVGLVLATAIAGSMLARSQGARVLQEIRGDLAGGRVPAAQLVDGLLILIGGIVLLTPGFLTDILGFLLILPFTRARLKRAVRARFERMVRSGQVHAVTFLR